MVSLRQYGDVVEADTFDKALSGKVPTFLRQPSFHRNRIARTAETMIDLAVRLANSRERARADRTDRGDLPR